MMAEPITAGGIAPLGRSQNYLEMVVRLEPDVDVRRAQAMATTVYANWLGEDASSQPQGAVPRCTLRRQVRDIHCCAPSTASRSCC